MVGNGLAPVVTVKLPKLKLPLTVFLLSLLNKDLPVSVSNSLVVSAATSFVGFTLT